MKKLIKFFDSNIYKSITAIMLILAVFGFYLKINRVLNLFDYDSIPEYWTVLNICY